MKKYRIAVIAAIGFIPLYFSSCDKIKEENYRTEIIRPKIVEPEEITDVSQKVLLEDFTGHKCPNCPEAAEEAHRLQEQYSNLIVVSIHNASAFSKPAPNDGYPEDFRTDEGEILKNAFGLQSFPNGLINRLTEDGSPVIALENWQRVVAASAEKDPVLYMTLKGSKYDSASGKVTIKVTTQYPKGFIEDLNMAALVMEDSIVAPQTMPDYERKEDYVHNHVLRQMPLGVWGIPNFAAPDSFQTGKSNAAEFDFQLRKDEKLPEMKPENCHLVVYFIRNNSTHKEIVQADKIALKEIISK